MKITPEDEQPRNSHRWDEKLNELPVDYRYRTSFSFVNINPSFTISHTQMSAVLVGSSTGRLHSSVVFHDQTTRHLRSGHLDEERCACRLFYSLAVNYSITDTIGDFVGIVFLPLGFEMARK